MDKDTLKTIIIVGLASAVGGLIRSLISGPQKPSLPAVMKMALVVLALIAIGIAVARNLK